jgi:hypothetical protein
MDQQNTNQPIRSSNVVWILGAIAVVLALSVLLFSGDVFTKTNSNANATATSNQNLNTASSATTNSAAIIDTSDWLTYENREYGFTFEYPDNWRLEEQEYNATGADALSRGGNRVVVSSPDSGEMFMVCPDERGPGCIVSHEPHVITQETLTQVDGHVAHIRNYKIGEVAGCEECARDLKTLKVVIDNPPDNWAVGEIMLVPSSEGTLIVAKEVLQTFVF